MIPKPFDAELVECFKEYTRFSTAKKPPSRREFLLNLEEKENDPDFAGDMEGILRSGIKYNQETAFEWVKTELLERI